MFDVETHKLRRSLAVPEDVNVHELLWHDNQTLLMVLSETTQSKHADATSRDYYRVIAQDVSGGDGRMLPMPTDRTKKFAPINAVKAIRIPVLIMYGAHNEVPVEQSQSIARALTAAGKNVTVVTLPSDTEWWVRAGSRVQLARELEEFFAEYLRSN